MTAIVGRYADAMVEPARDVAIRDQSIRLGQFLKLADLIDTGSDAKAVVADGSVRVNGVVETQRGRQLRHGDTVTLGDQVARVTGA
jgi:ribosome-associated protein